MAISLRAAATAPFPACAAGGDLSGPFCLRCKLPTAVILIGYFRGLFCSCLGSSMAVCCDRLPQLLAPEAYWWPSRDGGCPSDFCCLSAAFDACLKIIDGHLAAGGSLGGPSCLRLRLLNGLPATGDSPGGVYCSRLRPVDCQHAVGGSLSDSAVRGGA